MLKELEAHRREQYVSWFGTGPDSRCTGGEGARTRWPCGTPIRITRSNSGSLHTRHSKRSLLTRASRRSRGRSDFYADARSARVMGCNPALRSRMGAKLGRCGLTFERDRGIQPRRLSSGKPAREQPDRENRRGAGEGDRISGVDTKEQGAHELRCPQAQADTDGGATVIKHRLCGARAAPRRPCSRRAPCAGRAPAAGG